VSGFNDPPPKVARVLLRVEWADGQVRELDAAEPYGLEVRIGRLRPVPLLEIPLIPGAIRPGEATAVMVTFKASLDSDRHPFTIREPGP
jgi:hypothetical protein